MDSNTCGSNKCLNINSEHFHSNDDALLTKELKRVQYSGTLIFDVIAWCGHNQEFLSHKLKI